MNQPPLKPNGISLSSMKYLHRLKMLEKHDPFETQVIESHRTPPERYNHEDVTDDFNPPELQMSIFTDHQQRSELPIDSLGIGGEYDMFARTEQPNCSSLNFNNETSTSLMDIFNSPLPKRRRGYNIFNENTSIHDEFIVETNTTSNDSLFLQSGNFGASVDTVALFGDNSITGSTKRSHSRKKEQEQPSFVSAPSFNYNQLDENVTIADDEYDQQQNEGALFIDYTMMPQRCRDGILEKTVMQNENIVVNTAYTTHFAMKTSRDVIDNFYKVQRLKVNDWSAVAKDMKNLMEPNFDYLQTKLFPEMKVEIGDEKFNVNLTEEDDFGEIFESLEEIEKSFDTSWPAPVASTPNKSTHWNHSIVDKTDKPWESFLADDESRAQNELQMNVNALKQLDQSNDANNSKPVAVGHTDRSANSFNFSIVDPAEFMFSRNIYQDLQSAFVDSANESAFQGFPEEDLTEMQELNLELELEYQNNSQQNVPLAEKRRTVIIEQIGNIFHSLLQSLVQSKPMVLKIRTIRSWSDCKMNNEVLSQNEMKITTKSINFSNKASERTFTMTLTIMCEIYKMLLRNMTCAKRELYYRDVELFRNQENVNRSIDTISAMLNVQEFELGIVSSSKGLIAGRIIINIGDERIDCSSSTRAVPSNPSAITSFESSADFVLIVEKDTVFQRLVNDSVTFKQIKSKIVLVTAKGYPDINTRVLLKKMSMLLKKPMYILVDADPHGIEIMFTYKYGSLMKVHNSEHLAVSNINWIGIHPTDIDGLDVTHVDLTEADLKKVDDLLQRPYMNPFLKRELKFLKSRRIKAEIESIYHYSIDYLINDYIPRKIRLIEMPPMIP